MRNWTHEKTVVIQTHVRQIGLNFLKFDANFQRIRSDVNSCGLCEVKFQDNQIMHIAFTTNTVNKLICESCASVAVENGVIANQPNLGGN